MTRALGIEHTDPDEPKLSFDGAPDALVAIAQTADQWDYDPTDHATTDTIKQSLKERQWLNSLTKQKRTADDAARHAARRLTAILIA